MICDQENQTLRNEVSQLKSKENDDKIVELETLKSSNHILEEKLKILTQKLEISKKDCLEKENLLKKMASISTLNETDFQLFHNLTSELQKQTTTLNTFHLNDQNFKSQHIWELKKEPVHHIHERPIETHQKPIEPPPKPTEIQPKPIEIHQKPIEHPHKPIEIHQQNNSSKESPEKEQQCLNFEENKDMQGISIVQENNEAKSTIKETASFPNPIKNKEDSSPESQELRNINKPIEPPPQSFKKKIEEKKNAPPITNRNPIPGAFNHPKLASRNVPVIVPPKPLEPKKVFSNTNEGKNKLQLFVI